MIKVAMLQHLMENNFLKNLSVKFEEDGMAEWDRGCVQVYTGNGKGKTTAALGLTLRAAGAGLKVYFGQFIKGRDCAEIKGLALLGESVTLERFGSGRWVNKDKPEQYKEELELGQKGIKAVRAAVESDSYDLVVIDEALGALSAGVIELGELLEIIKTRPERLEVVLTGRNIPEKLRDIADLVSEIKPVKHYFQDGIPARKGIEF